MLLLLRGRGTLSMDRSSTAASGCMSVYMFTCELFSEVDTIYVLCIPYRIRYKRIGHDVTRVPENPKNQ